MAGKKGSNQQKAAAAQAGVKKKKKNNLSEENNEGESPSSPYNLRSPRRNVQREVSEDGTQPEAPKKRKPVKDFGDHSLQQIVSLG